MQFFMVPRSMPGKLLSKDLRKTRTLSSSTRKAVLTPRRLAKYLAALGRDITWFPNRPNTFDPQQRGFESTIRGTDYDIELDCSPRIRECQHHRSKLWSYWIVTLCDCQHHRSKMWSNWTVIFNEICGYLQVATNYGAARTMKAT